MNVLLAKKVFSPRRFQYTYPKVCTPSSMDIVIRRRHEAPRVSGTKLRVWKIISTVGTTVALLCSTLFWYQHKPLEPQPGCSTTDQFKGNDDDTGWEADRPPPAPHSQLGADPAGWAATALAVLKYPLQKFRFQSISGTNLLNQSGNKNVAEGNKIANALQQSGNKNVATGNQIRCTTTTTTTINNYNNPPECQPNSPEIDRMQCEETFSKLKRKLQCLYEKCILPCVNWIANGESLPLDEYYVQLEMSSVDGKTTQPIELKDIFKEQDAKIPKRILVESQPGFGKTTLAIKLIFDWAKGKEEYLKQFDLAFFIPLRQMQGKCLEEQIVEICADLKSRVNLNDDKHEKMLLVLDGFDEISRDSRDNVLKVLYQFEFSEMTIIVTSRPGIFPMDGKKLKELFPNHPQMTKDFHHKKVTIRGIRVEDRKRFLVKFCPNHDPQKVLDEIASIPKNYEVMFSSPLLLLLISYFIHLDMTVDVKSSLTDLYKSLFSNLVKSSLTRDGETISVQFDLFNVKDETSRKYQEMLERFGMLCLTKLRSEVFSFESDDDGFIKEIYKLGLLTKHKSFDIFKEKEHFECFHLSFMEFCIAYSTWRKFETHWCWQTTHTELFEKIRHVIQMSGQTSLIGLFLSGLLQEKVLSFLSHFKTNIFTGSNYFWKMTGQLKGNEQFAKSIINVLNKWMDTSDDQSKYFVDLEFFSYVMRNGILKGYIWLTLPAMIDCILPVNIIVPNIHLTLVRNRENETQKKCVNYLKQIQCEILEFEFDGKSSSDLFDEEYKDPLFLSDYFTIFLSIDVRDRKTFIIKNYNADSAFYHNLCYHFPLVGNLVILSVNGLDNIAVVEMICALLKTNSVYGLRLKFLDDSNDYNVLQRIIDLAVQCKSLWELHVENVNSSSSLRMDVHQFRKKEWRELYLSGFEFYCSELNKSLPCPRCQRGIKRMPYDVDYSESNVTKTNRDWFDNPIIDLSFE